MYKRVYVCLNLAFSGFKVKAKKIKIVIKCNYFLVYVILFNDFIIYRLCYILSLIFCNIYSVNVCIYMNIKSKLLYNCLLFFICSKYTF